MIIRKKSKLNRNTIAAFHDAVMAGLSVLVAVYIRLDENLFYLVQDYVPIAVPLFTGIAVAVFVSMRLYRGLWRYASMRDLVTIIKAVSLAILIFAAVMFLFNRLEGIPRSLFIIHWMLLVMMLAGPRFAYRAAKDRSLYWRMSLHETPKIPVLLVGANDQSEQFIRDMKRTPDALYEVVGIVDRDPKWHGKTIHNVAIYGGPDHLEATVTKLDRKARRPQKIILADDLLAGTEVQQLLDKANALGLTLARLPKLSQFRAGVSDKPNIQPIAVEDLLGRPQHTLDRESMRRLVAGKKIIITGAGGTIGSELAQQIASYAPKTLVLLELSELALYQIERGLRTCYPELSIIALLTDIRNEELVDIIFREHKPDLVFHAAAIKHVPLAQANPEETILTNVLGTQCIAEACNKHHTQAMVMISTDKAVNPSSVMGASKRLAESYCQALAEAADDKACKFMTVRFGNVLGSTGSVVPLFQEQLAKGGPLTVTHPDVSRYFMTVREAVELVLQAAAIGVGMPQRKECIFVLDMGEPVRIVDLARQMIRLAGMNPDEEIGIVYTGLRPGEKLHEALFHPGEQTSATSHSSIFLASARVIDIQLLRKTLERLYSACQNRNTPEALKIVSQLVPEYTLAHTHDDQTRAPVRIG